MFRQLSSTECEVFRQNMYQLKLPLMLCLINFISLCLCLHTKRLLMKENKEKISAFSHPPPFSVSRCLSCSFPSPLRPSSHSSPSLSTDSPSEEQRLLSTSLSPDLQPAPVNGSETITQPWRGKGEGGATPGRGQESGSGARGQEEVLSAAGEPLIILT